MSGRQVSLPGLGARRSVWLVLLAAGIALMVLVVMWVLTGGATSTDAAALPTSEPTAQAGDDEGETLTNGESVEDIDLSAMTSYDVSLVRDPFDPVVPEVEEPEDEFDPDDPTAPFDPDDPDAPFDPDQPFDPDDPDAPFDPDDPRTPFDPDDPDAPFDPDDPDAPFDPADPQDPTDPRAPDELAPDPKEGTVSGDPAVVVLDVTADAQGQPVAEVQVDAEVHEVGEGDRFAGTLEVVAIDGECVSASYDGVPFSVCVGETVRP